MLLPVCKHSENLSKKNLALLKLKRCIEYKSDENLGSINQLAHKLEIPLAESLILDEIAHRFVIKKPYSLANEDLEKYKIFKVLKNQKKQIIDNIKKHSTVSKIQSDSPASLIAFNYDSKILITESPDKIVRWFDLTTMSSKPIDECTNSYNYPLPSSFNQNGTSPHDWELSETDYYRIPRKSKILGKTCLINSQNNCIASLNSEKEYVKIIDNNFEPGVTDFLQFFKKAQTSSNEKLAYLDSSLAFSPDGHTFAYGSTDNTINLVNIPLYYASSERHTLAQVLFIMRGLQQTELKAGVCKTYSPILYKPIICKHSSSYVQELYKSLKVKIFQSIFQTECEQCKNSIKT